MSKRVDPWFAILAWWPACWHGGAAVMAWLLPMPIRPWVVAAWLIILPPLICHLVARIWPICGTYPVNCATARRWWWLQQVQMPFNRVTIIEEMLRLIPGLYQLWLRLWGGRVSLACVFSPQVVVTDRQLVTIGFGAVLGNGCMLGSHLVTRYHGWQVTVAPISIGSGSLIGARAMIGPGVVIGDDEQVPVGQPLPPFSTWKDGRRHKAVADG